MAMASMRQNRQMVFQKGDIQMKCIFHNDIREMAICLAETIDAIGFGCILPAARRVQDFHPLLERAFTGRSL